MTHKYKGSRHLLKVFKLISQIYPMQAWKEANLHNLVKGVQLSPELLDRIQGCNARLNRMRVDLYVPGQVAIEVHGGQHDRPVRFSNEIVDPDEELLRRRDFDEIKARALQISINNISKKVLHREVPLKDLRHSGAIFYLENGLPIDALGKFLGHLNFNSTIMYYGVPNAYKEIIKEMYE